jgi:creatinine amidohydrolase
MKVTRDIKGGEPGLGRFGVLPLGSVEYHGEQAHLGTDSILADYFADFIGESRNCARFPTVGYTPLPGKTAGYPGGITVRPDVFLAYLCDILAGIIKNGYKHLLVLNAHDGNIGLSRAAAEYATGLYPDADILIVNWWQMTSENWAEKECGLTAGGRGHGGAYEISAAYAAVSEEFVLKDARNLKPVKLNSAFPHVRVESRPANWEGRIGNLTEASLAAGKRILAEAGKNMLELIDEWLTKENGDV